MANSYSNTLGSGDRTSTMTVTPSSGLVATGASSLLVNGVTFAFDYYWNAVSGATLKFDFGVGACKTFDAFKWWQGNNQNHGAWQWFGSDDDSTYVARGSPFTLDGPIGGGAQEIFEPAGEIYGFRYWKMVQQSGTTNGGPYIYEIDFHIDDGTPYVLTSTGTLAATEGSDVAAFAGSLPGGFTGTLAATEGSDVANFHDATVTGTFHLTESPDVAAMLGTGRRHPNPIVIVCNN